MKFITTLRTVYLQFVHLLYQEPITDCIYTLYQEVYHIVDFASIIYDGVNTVIVCPFSPPIPTP